MKKLIINEIPNEPCFRIKIPFFELEDSLSYRDSLTVSYENGIINTIFNELKDITQITKLEFPFSLRSLHHWNNGSRNITLVNFLSLLQIWRKMSKMNEKEYTDKLSNIFDKLTLYSKNGTIPHVFNPRHAYYIGYHLGDGNLYENKIKNIHRAFYSDQSFKHLFFIRNLVKDLFKVNCRMKRSKISDFYRLEISSKSLVIWLNKICDIPIGKKNNLTVPQIVSNSSLEIKK